MDSIGQQLKAARERKGVTASQAAAATHMKVQHIEALEHDDYSRMTVPTYAKGFLKLYAEYLGLEPAPLLREYMARYIGQAAAQPAAAPPAAEGSVFKSPRRALPAAPVKFSLPPELVTRLLQVIAGVVVLLLLIWVVKHGCKSGSKPAAEVAPPPPPPAVTNHARPAPPPVAAPVKHEQATPWIIVNEPPPPYLKRSTSATP
jgi:cytoskeletal protein RodZ